MHLWCAGCHAPLVRFLDFFLKNQRFRVSAGMTWWSCVKARRGCRKQPLATRTPLPVTMQEWDSASKGGSREPESAGDSISGTPIPAAGCVFHVGPVVLQRLLRAGCHASGLETPGQSMAPSNGDAVDVAWPLLISLVWKLGLLRCSVFSQQKLSGMVLDNQSRRTRLWRLNLDAVMLKVC